MLEKGEGGTLHQPQNSTTILAHVQVSLTSSTEFHLYPYVNHDSFHPIVKMLIELDDT